MSIAIGDQPDYGTAYRAGGDLPICGEGHIFGQCERPGCDSDHHLVCTAPEGHFTGDVPHVACTARYGVVGIWDGQVSLLADLDDATQRLTNVGATLGTARR
jgi:hypothetical protein